MDIGAIAAITVLTVFSVATRWWAFHRVDLIAVEISSASLFYSFICLIVISTSPNALWNNLASSYWQLKILGGLFIVFVLAMIHHYFFNKLNDRISKKIEDAALKVQGNAPTKKIKKDALGATIPLLRHAIFLSYSTFFTKKTGWEYIRKGKLDARKAFSTLLCKICGVSQFGEDDFCLESKHEIIGIVTFNLLCIGAIFLAVWK